MAQSLTQIRCPNCGNPVQADIQQLVDIGQDPSAKARLLSGSHNHVLCPVCSYQGQVATPLVYHDPDKELLLTYIPVEIGMSKDEQEKFLGRLINLAVESLPSEKRKGYLLQPQSVLTIQGLIERVLEADGISKEELDAQRAKLQLFEKLLRTTEENIQEFVSEHDAELDATFFQLASLSLQSAPEGENREAINQRIQRVLELTSFGKELMAQEAEIRLAAESIQQAGDQITHEILLDLFIEAQSDMRVDALVQLTRPALDYTFFQRLTERIEAAEGDEESRLSALRTRVLTMTEEMDKVQEQRAAETAALIQGLVEAEDLDEAIKQILPRVDELFVNMLQANIRAARERQDGETVEKLERIDTHLRSIVQESLPPGLQLAQKLLEIDDPDLVSALLNESAEQIDEEMLGALLSTTQRLEQSGDETGAEHVREIYRQALQLSMKKNL
jgi:hypothetical protein